MSFRNAVFISWLLILGSAFQALAQDQSILIYAVGDAGLHSPFCEIHSNGYRLGTVKLGEYSIVDTDLSRSPIIEIHRSGFETETLHLAPDDSPHFVRVSLSPKGLSVMLDAFPPEAIADLLPTPAGTKNFIGSSDGIIQDTQDWPPSGSAIQLRFEGTHDSPTSDILEGIVIAALDERYTIVNRDRLRVILEEQKVSMSGITTEHGGPEAGKILTTEWTVFVRYSGDAAITSRFTIVNNETAKQGVPFMTERTPRSRFVRGLRESLLWD